MGTLSDKHVSCKIYEANKTQIYAEGLWVAAGQGKPLQGDDL